MPHPSYDKGLEAMECGDGLAALLAFEAVLEHEPDNADAWNMKGRAHEMLDEFEEALLSYDEAADVDPKSTVAHLNRGYVLQALGRIDDSNAAFAKAVRRDPNNLEAVEQHSINLLKRGDVQAAAAVWDKRLAKDPSNADLHRGRGLVDARADRHEESKSHFRRAIELAPEDPKAYMDLGSAHYQLEQYDEAIAAYDGFLAKVSEGRKAVDVLFCKGMSQFLADRAEASIETFQRILELDRSEHRAEFQIGQSNVKLQRYEDALASFDRSIAINATKKAMLMVQGIPVDRRTDALCLFNAARVNLLFLDRREPGINAIEMLIGLDGKSGVRGAQELAAELAAAGHEEVSAVILEKCLEFQDR